MPGARAESASHSAGMGQCGVSPGDRARAPITIAAAQSRSVPGDIDVNIERHLQFLHVAADHAVGLIVFPELSLTGYESTLAKHLAMTPRDERLRPLDETVVGAPLAAGRGEPYLGAIAFTPAGTIAYAKQHLHDSEEAYFSPEIGTVTRRRNRSTVQVHRTGPLTRFLLISSKLPSSNRIVLR